MGIPSRLRRRRGRFRGPLLPLRQDRGPRRRAASRDAGRRRHRHVRCHGHAVGPDLTQLSSVEGTLGVITRVTVKLVDFRRSGGSQPWPCRPSRAGSKRCARSCRARVRPAVIRFYDAEAARGDYRRCRHAARGPDGTATDVRGEREVADAEAEGEAAATGRPRRDAARRGLTQTMVERRLRPYTTAAFTPRAGHVGNDRRRGALWRILDVYHAIRAALAPFEADGLRFAVRTSATGTTGHDEVNPEYVIPTSRPPRSRALYRSICGDGHRAIHGARERRDQRPPRVGATLAPSRAPVTAVTRRC
jgi:hypothetical protein